MKDVDFVDDCFLTQDYVSSDFYDDFVIACGYVLSKYDLTDKIEQVKKERDGTTNTDG